MWNEGFLHGITAAIALLQLCLTSVLGYRIYLLRLYNKGAEPHRRPLAMRMITMHRGALVVVTVFQCLRCIDPFCALSIWPYLAVRVLQGIITIAIYFCYGATSYVLVDTLYACALKRTPLWLYYGVGVLPFLQGASSFLALGLELGLHHAYFAAANAVFLVLTITTNCVLYNAAAFHLIRLLKRHKNGDSDTGSNETGSKEASPYDVVIVKTFRGILLLTLPTVILFIYCGANLQSNLTSSDLPTFGPNTPPALGSILAIFIQMAFSLSFTRFAWISKEQLLQRQKEQQSNVGRASSEPSSEVNKARSSTRADLMDRAKCLSQAPNPKAKTPDGSPLELPQLPSAPSSTNSNSSSSSSNPCTPSDAPRTLLARKGNAVEELIRREGSSSTGTDSSDSPRESSNSPAGSPEPNVRQIAAVHVSVKAETYLQIDPAEQDAPAAPQNVVVVEAEHTVVDVAA